MNECSGEKNQRLASKKKHSSRRLQSELREGVVEACYCAGPSLVGEENFFHICHDIQIISKLTVGLNNQLLAGIAKNCAAIYLILFLYLQPICQVCLKLANWIKRRLFGDLMNCYTHPGQRDSQAPN